MQSNALIWAAQESTKHLRSKFDLLLDREQFIRDEDGDAQSLATVLRQIKALAMKLHIHGIVSREQLVEIEIRRRDADSRWCWLAFNGVETVGTEIAFRDDALEVLTLRFPGSVMESAGDQCLMSWKILNRDIFNERYGRGDAYTVAKTKAWTHVNAVAGIVGGFEL